MEEDIHTYLGKRLLQDSSNKEAIALYLNELPKEKLIELILSFVETPESSSSVPLSVLTAGELSALEAVCYYLKTYRDMSNKGIAEALSRRPQAVWTSLRNAGRKLSGELPVRPSSYDIPLEHFREGFSILENVVYYLKTHHNWRFSDIAKALNRNPRTIWTVYQRALRKRE